MKASNLKSFALGFGIAISALGLYALAATLNTFASGDVVSSSKINENFTNLNTDVVAASTAAVTANTGVTTLNTKVTALEAKKVLPARGAFYAYAFVGDVIGTVNSLYSFNPLGTITVAKPSTGRYIVTFGGTVNDSASDKFIRHVQVTGYGDNSNFCKIVKYVAPDVTVQCYTLAGVLVDNSFDIQVSN